MFHNQFWFKLADIGQIIQPASHGLLPSHGLLSFSVILQSRKNDRLRCNCTQQRSSWEAESTMSRTSPRLMQPECSLPCTQQPSTFIYLRPNSSTPQPPTQIFFKIHFKIILPFMPKLFMYFASFGFSHKNCVCTGDCSEHRINTEITSDCSEHRINTEITSDCSEHHINTEITSDCSKHHINTEITADCSEHHIKHRNNFGFF